jgi:L-asparagine oxygenase
MDSDCYGTHLQSLDDVTIRISDSERDSIQGECTDRTSGLYDLPLDSEALLTEAELAGSLLPDRVLRILGQFRRSGNRAGALLIKNLPVDARIPATPDRGSLPHWNELPVATFAQLAVASVIGDVIAYADEKDGNLIQDIVPLKGSEDRQENSGTVYLELHTEDGFHPHKPDFVTLFCLRPDQERIGRTLVGAAVEVLPQLPGDCVAILQTPVFRLRTSSSFGDRRTCLLTRPVPVLSGPVTAPELLADFHAMEPLSDGARAALDQLKEALLPSLRSASLNTGDLIVIDNRAAVHGRTPFAARFDGTDRWLRRCFAVSDIRRSRGARPPGSRVCAPLTTIGVSLDPVS